MLRPFYVSLIFHVLYYRVSWTTQETRGMLNRDFAINLITFDQVSDMCLLSNRTEGIDQMVVWLSRIFVQGDLFSRKSEFKVTLEEETWLMDVAFFGG